MKKRYLVTASLLALTAGSQAAGAADIVTTTMEPAVIVSAPVFSWDGFYAGGQIGGSWARGKVNTWQGGVDESWSTKPDGFIGGLYAGYNFDVGNNIIIGADTDFVWADVDGSQEQGTGKLRIKQKWVGSTRLRAGYAADRWLPYIAAGVAYGRINGRGSSPEGELDIFNKTRVGWTAGTGVDYAVTDNVLLRLEYRYVDLGKKTYDSKSFRVKYYSNDFRVGVAYKF